MRSLLLSSLLIVVFACSPVSKSKLTRIDEASSPVRNWSSPFASGFEKALFKATMDIGKTHLSGLVLVKKTTDTTFRIVFSNEMGFTFFDLEMKNNTLFPMTLFESFNRKSFLKILEKDLAILLASGFSPASGKYYKNPSPPETILFNNKTKTYLKLADNRLDTAKLLAGTTPIDKTIISMRTGENGFPLRIIIRNPGIRFVYRLSLLNR